MSNMLKCPNPSCPYVFDPSQVPVGVVLSCPRCAMQFTLGPPAPAAPPSNVPGAPFPPTEPDFTGVTGTATQTRPARTDYGPEGPPVRSNKTQTFILAGIVAVLLAGSALAIIFKVMRRGGHESADTASRLTDINIGVDTPPAGWTRDDNMRVKLGSPYVMSYRRESPEAYMAFGANSFGNTDPKKGHPLRPSEMKTDQMRAFPKLFDMNSVRSENPTETKWLGESIPPELGFKFRAQSNDGLSWAGEAYVVTHKGYAYYWLSWCQEADYDGLKDQFASFRSKFKALELRQDWQETQSSIIDYKGDKVPYTLSDSEEVWREFPIGDEKMANPDLDRLLRLRLTPKGDRHALPDEGELRVHILDVGGEPLEAARTFAEAKEVERIRELNPEFQRPTFEVLDGPEQGDPVSNTVPRSAPVLRLKSKVAESSNAGRLIVVSGLKVGDKMVVVRGWCEYSKRNVLETKLVQIASSLR